MATERERQAAAYLEKHKITELFNLLTSLMVFQRPENPREFLITQLERLKASGPDLSTSLFDEANLEAVFRILDPVNKGYISAAQYREALTTLGVQEFEQSPEGSPADQISRETFLKQAKEGLVRTSAPFRAA